MYKLLLSWRYLRSRYIALASIISVTLGVATLVVVNSVMAGFSAEMHKRLHGILSDIVIESPGLDGIFDADWHIREIRKVAGNDLEAITAIVRVPAMLHFQFRGRTITQQVMLIGVDPATYGKVSQFSPYLLHPENQKQLSFQLRDGGFDKIDGSNGPRLPDGGWSYRRSRVQYERAYEEEIQRLQAIEERATTAQDDTDEVQFAPLPDQAPQFDTTTVAESSEPADPLTTADPFLAEHEAMAFDAMNEQYVGIILGMGVISQKYHDPSTDTVEEMFFCLPGDDVQITLPSNGMPPQPISGLFTVVDFYESKMSEYDSSFAFMPIHELQKMRGMIDRQSGIPTVTSIQLKLKPEADLNAVRDRLRERFPPHEYPYRVQTWREMQGPLLAAVQLETTILNILLFMIIAVAGFGILATFFMIVVEKTRDIGILKSLGAPSRGVASIFLSYGVSLGIVGSGVGIVLGLLFVVYINTIADWVEWITGQPVFDETVYYFQEIPTIINPLTVVWVAVGAVMIAVMASVLPSMRAARMHPVEALRYE